MFADVLDHRFGGGDRGASVGIEEVQVRRQEDDDVVEVAGIPEAGRARIEGAAVGGRNENEQARSERRRDEPHGRQRYPGADLLTTRARRAPSPLRSSAAAPTIAPSFASATRAEATGLSATVAIPQGGEVPSVCSSRGLRKPSGARSSRRDSRPRGARTRDRRHPTRRRRSPRPSRSAQDIKVASASRRGSTDSRPSDGRPKIARSTPAAASASSPGFLGGAKKMETGAVFGSRPALFNRSRSSGIRSTGFLFGRMIGIQPSPNSTTRSNVVAPSPPMRIGGRGRCTSVRAAPILSQFTKTPRDPGALFFPISFLCPPPAP